MDFRSLLCSPIKAISGNREKVQYSYAEVLKRMPTFYCTLLHTSTLPIMINGRSRQRKGQGETGCRERIHIAHDHRDIIINAAQLIIELLEIMAFPISE